MEITSYKVWEPFSWRPHPTGCGNHSAGDFILQGVGTIQLEITSYRVWEPIRWRSHPAGCGNHTSYRVWEPFSWRSHPTGCGNHSAGDHIHRVWEPFSWRPHPTGCGNQSAGDYILQCVGTIQLETTSYRVLEPFSWRSFPQLLNHAEGNFPLVVLTVQLEGRYLSKGWGNRSQSGHIHVPCFTLFLEKDNKFCTGHQNAEKKEKKRKKAAKNKCKRSVNGSGLARSVKKWM